MCRRQSRQTEITFLHGTIMAKCLFIKSIFILSKKAALNRFGVGFHYFVISVYAIVIYVLHQPDHLANPDAH